MWWKQEGCKKENKGNTDPLQILLLLSLTSFLPKGGVLRNNNKKKTLLVLSFCNPRQAANQLPQSEWTCLYFFFLTNPPTDTNAHTPKDARLMIHSSVCSHLPLVSKIISLHLSCSSSSNFFLTFHFHSFYFQYLISFSVFYILWLACLFFPMYIAL